MTSNYMTSNYKHGDGTWNRSKILSRGHERVAQMDEDRPYNERLSGGMTQAWEEAKSAGETENDQETGICVSADDWKEGSGEEEPQDPSIGYNLPDGWDFESGEKAGTVYVTPPEPIPDPAPDTGIDNQFITCYRFYDMSEDALRAFAHRLSVTGDIDEALDVLQESCSDVLVSADLDLVPEGEVETETNTEPTSRGDSDETTPEPPPAPNAENSPSERGRSTYRRPPTPPTPREDSNSGTAASSDEVPTPPSSPTT
mgnify:CR=1 FL=1